MENDLPERIYSILALLDGKPAFTPWDWRESSLRQVCEAIHGSDMGLHYTETMIAGDCAHLVTDFLPSANPEDYSRFGCAWPTIISVYHAVVDAGSTLDANKTCFLRMVAIARKHLAASLAS